MDIKLMLTLQRSCSMIWRLIASLPLWAKRAMPDRDTLRHDLLICYGRYSIASGPGQSGFVKRQSERLNSIQKHASKLMELLKADDADLRIIRSVWPITPERPAHLLRK